MTGYSGIANQCQLQDASFVSFANLESTILRSRRLSSNGEIGYGRAQFPFWNSKLFQFSMSNRLPAFARSERSNRRMRKTCYLMSGRPAMTSSSSSKERPRLSIAQTTITYLKPTDSANSMVNLVS
jgi:hypothetical protein